MKVYHTPTQTLYNGLKQAGLGLKVLGLNDTNMVDHGLVIANDDPKPTLASNQTAVLSDLPTENPDNSWTFKWTVNTKPTEQLRALIKRERNRRLEADFVFQGKAYQRDSKSLDRITGAGTLAGLWLVVGGSPISLKWHATPENPTPDDFVWIASDDTLVPMDAQTCLAFAKEAAAVETRVIFAAKQLRSMDPIPEDFTEDKWWP